MSLEDALAAHTAAIEKNTAALERFMAAAKVKAPEPDEKPKAAAKAPAKAAAKKGKEPWETDEGFKTAAGEYLKSEESKEGRVRIRETVQPILTHFGVSKFTEIAEDQREEAYGYIKALHDAHNEGGIDAAEAVDLGLSNEDDSLV